MSFFEPTASAVHFSAGINSTWSVNSSTLTTIIFGNVIANTTVNSVDVYSGTTGIFTAPVTGIYFFTFNVALTKLVVGNTPAAQRFGFQYGGTTGAYTNTSLVTCADGLITPFTSGSLIPYSSRHSITIKLTEGHRCTAVVSEDPVDQSSVSLQFNYATVKPIFAGYLVAEVP